MLAANRMRGVFCVAWLVLLGSSCASKRWDGRVRQHGSVEEAMRGGAPGRAGLFLAQREHRWGLGVLEGAAGEVLVADGYVWVGRGETPRQARTDAGFPPRTRASWLALARVPRWREHALEHEVDLAGLGELVARLAQAEGWDATRPVPFVVNGALSEVELHIVRGACPYSDALSPATEPFAARFSVAHGTLVGLHAPGSEGELVHHGQTVHAHALLRQPSTLAAHVDSVQIPAGALVRVPRR